MVGLTYWGCCLLSLGLTPSAQVSRNTPPELRSKPCFIDVFAIRFAWLNSSFCTHETFYNTRSALAPLEARIKNTHTTRECTNTSTE